MSVIETVLTKKLLITIHFKVFPYFIGYKTEGVWNIPAVSLFLIPEHFTLIFTTVEKIVALDSHNPPP